ncbi:MAG: hypothetical protein NTU97_00900 [Candidatus Magasanikbacteria bacterium]|nr:hypothetical protein [Candidatus Magasanikbacteria bacterium]
MLTEVVVILILTILGWVIAFVWAPFLAKLLVRYKCYKKQVRTVAPDGSGTPIFAALHKEREIAAPRMAGVLFWVTTGALALLFVLLGKYQPEIFAKFDFVSRSQTWIPLFTLISASILGFVDDVMVVRGSGRINKGGGLKFRHRLLVVFLIGLVGAYWFYFKLGWDTIHVPFYGDLHLGIFYIILFIITMIGLFSGSVIDGLDGLAGGVFAIIFTVYSIISFVLGQYNLSAFCGILAGTLTAFLWFNIPPAKFYMGETGILGLTTTLAVVAFLTNTVLLLPFIAFILLAEIFSVVLQMWSKKYRHKKIFLVAPLHHHFEAKGWPSYQVTMRFWLITGATSLVGLILFLIDKV